MAAFAVDFCNRTSLFRGTILGLLTPTLINAGEDPRSEACLERTLQEAIKFLDSPEAQDRVYLVPVSSSMTEDDFVIFYTPIAGQVISVTLVAGYTTLAAIVLTHGMDGLFDDDITETTELLDEPLEVAAGDRLDANVVVSTGSTNLLFAVRFRPTRVPV